MNLATGKCPVNGREEQGKWQPGKPRMGNLWKTAYELMFLYVKIRGKSWETGSLLWRKLYINGEFSSKPCLTTGGSSNTWFFSFGTAKYEFNFTSIERVTTTSCANMVVF